MSTGRGKAAKRVEDPREQAARLKGDPRLSGSKSGELTLILVNQACQAAFYGRDPQEGFTELQQDAIVAALEGIAPRDPLEGMLAAQLVSVHNGVMDCLRRAQHPDQTFAGREMNLGMANKLSRTYATLLDALNKHRGKGQQVVRVEHVTVHAGGQAIVGSVSHPGGGDGRETDGRPHARALAHAPEPEVWRENAERKAVPCADDW